MTECQLLLIIDGVMYAFSIVAPRPGETKAFTIGRAFTKGDYRVSETADGLHCGCQGFSRRRRCKHLEALRAVRILPGPGQEKVNGDLPTGGAWFTSTGTKGNA